MPALIDDTVPLKGPVRVKNKTINCNMKEKIHNLWNLYFDYEKNFPCKLMVISQISLLSDHDPLKREF